MSARMKECLRPHSLMHSLTGLGVGLILVGLVPTIGANALVLGIVLLVVGFLGDFAVNKG